MRVLVVEDERRLAAAVRRGLEDHGFAVEVAHDGEAGFWLARDEAFDVIVLDILLPQMSGYEVCKRLRAEGVWTPILMLTAKDGEYDEADALDLGADDYLRKPFSYVVLVARLNALLRRGAPERPAQLRVGDLVLDPSRRSVRRGETPIELTRREFALLEYLMRNVGEPKSKYEILDHVWGADFDRGPNVVEVYVGYLRRKVDAPFGTHTIQTVRTHGYRAADE
ncbi:MAG: response regulator transcription factor [Egibacteraceae bacterium]